MAIGFNIDSLTASHNIYTPKGTAGAMVHNHPSALTPQACQICANRQSDLNEPRLESSEPPPLLIIVLHFKTLLTKNPSSRSIPDSPHYTALQRTLASITSYVETVHQLAQFTTWSPALDDGHIAIILTTAAEDTISATSPVFAPVTEFLVKPPWLASFKFDPSIVSLAASSPHPSIAVDIILLTAPNSSIAVEIGKTFGWGPKRSSLADVINRREPGSPFPIYGDLVRDFFGWADWTSEDTSSSQTPKTDTKSGAPSAKGLTLNDADSHDEATATEHETLVMIFQWSSSSKGERFKDPAQTSYGINGRKIFKDFWKHIADPVKEMQVLGANVESYRLMLRGVEFTEEVQEEKKKKKKHTRSSRSLSVMASGLGERVSGLWK